MIEQGTVVLVVDDDATFNATLSRALKERGLVVHSARDAATALRIVQEEAPELAILDMRLGDEAPLGGLALVKALHEGDAETRIVVLTGYGSITTAVSAIRAGALSYLQKPASVSEILRAFAGEEQKAVPETPSLARLEWEHLLRVLGDCHGNVSEAARRLGLHRRSLQRKLGKGPPLS